MIKSRRDRAQRDGQVTPTHRLLRSHEIEEVEAPEKSLVLIEGASHFAAFTQPGQFLAALRTIQGTA